MALVNRRRASPIVRALIPLRMSCGGEPSRRAGATVLALALCLSTGGCAWLDRKQRELALRPTPTQATDSATLQPSDQRYMVDVLSADGEPERLALWWLPHEDAQAPALLYLHGTFRNLYRNLPKIEALREAGFAVLAVDYRGWGDSTPIVPSEQTIVADAWVAWAELAQRQPIAGRRVIYGHSMGSAVAVTLASQLRHGRDYGALVLESSFSSLPEVAGAAGFWGRVGAAVTTLQFDAVSKIAKVDAPILMLHGSADRTVPVELGRRLRDAAPAGVTWVEVPGGTHSRLHLQAWELYRDSLRALIAELPTGTEP
jgi:pimeloyl-ACP methyl ester carboxylesterase